MVGMAFIAQAGCRFTAQLGAMRINEEIDSLEAMAINPIPYLVTTRAVASVIAVVPCSWWRWASPTCPASSRSS